jgi:hypothetical protein
MTVDATCSRSGAAVAVGLADATEDEIRAMKNCVTGGN